MSLAIGGYNTFFPVYSAAPVDPVGSSPRVMRGSEGAQTDAGTIGQVEKGECQTCKNRKYVDGSNENNVSFQTPGHISPENSASKVMAHEQEHVANAVARGSQKGNKLISASVTLHTSICPECGRVYVSGGVTHTMVQTGGEEKPQNPYVKLQQTMNRNLLAGMNFDQVA